MKGMSHKKQMGMTKSKGKGYKATGAMKGSHKTKYVGAMKRGSKKGY